MSEWVFQPHHRKNRMAHSAKRRGNSNMEAPNHKHLPSSRKAGLRAGRPNNKQIPMIRLPNWKQNRFGYLGLVFGVGNGFKPFPTGICLPAVGREFVIWDF